MYCNRLHTFVKVGPRCTRQACCTVVHGTAVGDVFTTNTWYSRYHCMYVHRILYTTYILQAVRTAVLTPLLFHGEAHVSVTLSCRGRSSSSPIASPARIYTNTLSYIRGKNRNVIIPRVRCSASSPVASLGSLYTSAVYLVCVSQAQP